ncbi:MAG TPA: hypothetical protein DCP57_04200 [Gammaproteobacteria bacterium]|jgi:phage shock protein C|nr:MAG: PspC domain-containing protein [OM182 bacterium]HAL41625.1 hypothetical protein [Gammaproteobacteria bacterium]HBK18389.1 hypothetical protein [Gammaproteobacteria bacterium]|tara:strand:+ start:12572 stop:12820 length:249 start_codon:yes stop_codon:yes gene_type:complete
MSDSTSNWRAKAGLDKVFLNREHACLFGVCSGVADYFEMERGIVRTCTVIGAIFFSNLTIAAYLIAWVLLEEKPKNSEKDVN